MKCNYYVVKNQVQCTKQFLYPIAHYDDHIFYQIILFHTFFKVVLKKYIDLLLIKKIYNAKVIKEDRV